MHKIKIQQILEMFCVVCPVTEKKSAGLKRKLNLNVSSLLLLLTIKAIYKLILLGPQSAFVQRSPEERKSKGGGRRGEKRREAQWHESGVY